MMRGNLIRAALVAAFLGCIWAANYVTGAVGTFPTGFGFEIAAGTWFAGLTLVIRDGINESFRRPVPWVVMLVLIGAAVSYGFSPGAIALASALAFGVAELSDFVVYQRIRDHSRAQGVLVSGLVGAAVDTALFLSIASDAVEQASGHPVTTGLWAGQFAVKAVLSIVVALIVLTRERRVVRG